MNIVCVDNNQDKNPITPGKMYFDITSNWKEGLDGQFAWSGGSMNKIAYLILNDDGYESWEPKENFLTLEEFRDNKLNDLGL